MGIMYYKHDEIDGIDDFEDQIIEVAEKTINKIGAEGDGDFEWVGTQKDGAEVLLRVQFTGGLI